MNLGGHGSAHDDYAKAKLLLSCQATAGKAFHLSEPPFPRLEGAEAPPQRAE